jgi:hypothetical protein
VGGSAPIGWMSGGHGVAMWENSRGFQPTGIWFPFSPLCRIATQEHRGLEERSLVGEAVPVSLRNTEYRGAFGSVG